MHASTEGLRRIRLLARSPLPRLTTRASDLKERNPWFLSLETFLPFGADQDVQGKSQVPAEQS
jgi:hypothetical protein